MQQPYSLGERRSSRAGNFSFFQVHLLKLHVLNCTEISPEPERQQKATIRIVSCPALHALVLALTPSLKVASRKLVLHNQNMHLDSASTIAESFVGTGSSLQSAQLISDQATGCFPPVEGLEDPLLDSSGKKSRQIHTRTLLWSEVGRFPGNTYPAGWKCSLMHVALIRHTLMDPARLSGTDTLWSVELFSTYREWKTKKKRKNQKHKNPTKVSDKQLP